MPKAIRLMLGAALLLAPSLAQSADGAQKMRCTPKVLHSGDTLKITLPFPHGQYFDVFGPGGREFWLAEGADKEIIPRETFRQMRSIELSVSQAEGMTSVSRHQEVSMREGIRIVSDIGPAKIFVRPGRYILKVGQDLETDDGFFNGSCAVRFVGK